jgi:Flp pilus assembly pilin Flp
MFALLQKLLRDEEGFVVSSELILIATIVSLSMAVGLTEVSHAVTRELIDVGNGFSRLNQSSRYRSLGSNNSQWNSNQADLIELSGSSPVDEGQ